MLKSLWRSIIAPGLTVRLAPRVLEALRPEMRSMAEDNVGASLPHIRPSEEPAPETPAPGELQIYRGYEDADLQLFEQFLAPNRIAQPGFIVDFLGAKTRTTSLYDQVASFDGIVMGPPIPGDYHAEAVEWLGLLKTVRTAGSCYTAMEWGAGWAPWLISGAVAARLTGVPTCRLYGIEADADHFESMRQHFDDNHIDPAEHVLLQAAVGAEAGTARWPKYPDPKNAWGARPLRELSADDEDYHNPDVREFQDIEVLRAHDLLVREPLWDMLHIDIQGWEGEVCRSCIDTISDRVKWVIIGVHSQILDATLLQIFHEAGWILEHEKPTRFRFAAHKSTFESMVIADGTQVWRNPRLTP